MTLGRLTGLECDKILDELERLHVKHDLFLDEGYIFGKEGVGFERINIACPRHVLADALKRMSEAYSKF